MFIVKTKAHLQMHLMQVNSKVGFVPTMGALHQGHISLIKASVAKKLFTVCSIFVNPTQFNQAADLENYPSNIAQDIALLAESGCQLLFMPTVNEMYGSEITSEPVSYGAITDSLEGLKRPGHFNGVITIVSKLFDAVKPDEVFFGQKDFQQCAVIKKLIELRYADLTFNMMPTQREANGLAMSSRNERLSQEHKNLASAIYKTLQYCKSALALNLHIDNTLLEAKQKFLSATEFNCEYLELVDKDTLEPLKHYDKTRGVLVIACWCANVRLIDNMLLSE